MTDKQIDLKYEAKCLYFKNIKAFKYRKSFLKKIENCIVVDKRNDGFHCCHCGKFSKDKLMSFDKDAIVSCGKINQGEVWIVYNHYDGCRGWD